MMNESVKKLLAVAVLAFVFLVALCVDLKVCLKILFYHEKNEAVEKTSYNVGVLVVLPGEIC